MRSCYRRGCLAAGKVTALRAAGVEFDSQKARAIREQHEAMMPSVDSLQMRCATSAAHRKKRPLANVGDGTERRAKRPCVKPLPERYFRALLPKWCAGYCRVDVMIMPIDRYLRPHDCQHACVWYVCGMCVVCVWYVPGRAYSRGRLATAWRPSSVRITGSLLLLHAEIATAPTS
jgi:hypothetical protein